MISFDAMSSPVLPLDLWIEILSLLDYKMIEKVSRPTPRLFTILPSPASSFSRDPSKRSWTSR